MLVAEQLRQNQLNVLNSVFKKSIYAKNDPLLLKYADLAQNIKIVWVHLRMKLTYLD